MLGMSERSYLFHSTRNNDNRSDFHEIQYSIVRYVITATHKIFFERLREIRLAEIC